MVTCQRELSILINYTEEQRDNLELALLDIYEGSASVPYYSERLKDSDKVAKALIDTNNKWKISYMSDRIRKKYNID